MRAINRAAKRGNKGMNQFERRNYFVEKVLRKYLIKNMLNVFEKEENVVMSNDTQIHLISTNHVGNYGYLGSLKPTSFGDVWGNKYSRKWRHIILVLEDILRNAHNFKCYYEVDWYDGHKIKSIFITPVESEFVSHSTYDFIKLQNGQYYDIDNRYWFDLEASKELQKYVDNNWDYYNPVNFLEEVYGD